MFWMSFHFLWNDFTALALQYTFIQVTVIGTLPYRSNVEYLHPLAVLKLGCPLIESSDLNEWLKKNKAKLLFSALTSTLFIVVICSMMSLGEETVRLDISPEQNRF